MARTSLSSAQARRIALGAQGFGGVASPRAAAMSAKTAGAPGALPEAAPALPATTAAPGTRQLNQAIDRLGLLQIDSVNVFERSHYLPLFARLGPYDRALLDRLTFARKGRYTEYWAHEAAFLPVESWPLWRFRMEAFRERWAADDSWASTHKPMLQWLLDHLRSEGPQRASDIEHESNVRRGPWWGWSDVKQGLEVLFRIGDVVSAGRTRFERTYGLPEQILPPAVLDATVSREASHRALLAQAAKSHGVGTTKDLADYFRLKGPDVSRALDELVELGDITRVEVEGWKGSAFLHRDARLPRAISADALLSPFDPVVWERARTERLFGFHYRIEIYTPQPKRVFGYYVLPVLQDDALVGRLDLKSDRQAGVLRVQASWHEGGQVVDTERLAALLLRAAEWQGLESVAVVERGDLARELAGALGVTMVAPELVAAR